MLSYLVEDLSSMLFFNFSDLSNQIGGPGRLQSFPWSERARAGDACGGFWGWLECDDHAIVVGAAALMNKGCGRHWGHFNCLWSARPSTHHILLFEGFHKTSRRTGFLIINRVGVHHTAFMHAIVVHVLILGIRGSILVMLLELGWGGIYHDPLF